MIIKIIHQNHPKSEDNKIKHQNLIVENVLDILDVKILKDILNDFKNCNSDLEKMYGVILSMRKRDHSANISYVSENKKEISEIKEHHHLKSNSESNKIVPLETTPFISRPSVYVYATESGRKFVTTFFEGLEVKPVDKSSNLNMVNLLCLVTREDTRLTPERIQDLLKDFINFMNNLLIIFVCSINAKVESEDELADRAKKFLNGNLQKKTTNKSNKSR